MYFSRTQLEQHELDTLAGYALYSRESRGRRHHEPEPRYRTAFQRDRDRIVHSAAFRLLEYKTLVFVNDAGDYFRTRLTHTLEVAQIGRTLARALGVNEDLVEAVCLAHDLGHPTFGHAGEGILNQLMADFGGFNHNHQSYRVVTKLEKRYPDWNGLNLTFETLEGISSALENGCRHLHFHWMLVTKDSSSSWKTISHLPFHSTLAVLVIQDYHCCPLSSKLRPLDDDHLLFLNYLHFGWNVSSPLTYSPPLHHLPLQTHVGFQLVRSGPVFAVRSAESPALISEYPPWLAPPTHPAMPMLADVPSASPAEDRSHG